MKRPKGFTFLSLYLVYTTYAGIITGFALSAKYGSVSAILGCIYGFSALPAAYGIWFLRPWAFHAMAFWSITALAWFFNWQYGLNGKYTLPLHHFIIYLIFIITLFAAIAYYIKKKINKLNEIEKC